MGCLRIILLVSLLLILAESGLCKVEVNLQHETVSKHIVFDYAFASMSASDDTELVLIESGSEDFYEAVISINRIEENSQRIVLYEAPLQTLEFKLLVGDIDGDRKDEVVLHKTDHVWDDESLGTSRVIEVYDEKFQEIQNNSLDGERGVLIDIDQDGKQEILVVAFTELLTGGEGLYPTEIRLYSYESKKFNLVDRYDIGDSTVQCITAGDVDLDGRSEIVTQEASHTGEVLHQISVYEVDESGTITHAFSKNGALSFSTFPIRLRAMRVFVGHDSNAYISGYKSRSPMLLRVENSGEIEDLVPLKGDMRLRTAALSQRLPFDGSFYAQIISRKPQLELFEYAELRDVVLEIDKN